MVAGPAYMLLLVLGLVILIGSFALAYGLSDRHAWRWGTSEAKVVAPAGGYRDAALTQEVARPVPPLIPLVASTGFVWAAITLLVFAPAGALFTMMLEGHRLACVCFLTVTVSGFGLGIGLIVAGLDLVRCRERAPSTARSVGTWSLVHHAAVLVATCVTAAAEGGDSAALILVAAVPCALGALHAFGLLRAAQLPAPEAPS